MRTRILTLLIVFLINHTYLLKSQNLSQVTGFGTNPGNLNMYTYIPNGISGAAPLVIAMHGCTQSASIYASQTGWNKLADLHKFYVIYPEQLATNNSNKCFNWFDAADQDKNQGEALSIKQMVDYMINNYSVTPSAIYVTGLSAGAAMSSVMLADYPEIFRKGAIMAGLPYKAATSSLNAFTAMNGGVTKTPSQWGDLVRNQNPNYTGTQPHVAIFHGTMDFTVNIANATELIKQWTDVNGTDQTVDNTYSSFDGNSIIEKTVYTNNSSDPVVVYYKITGMGHAISLDTGACPRQGGVTGTYALEKDFHSTYWAADFFNILINPYTVTGSGQVAFSATNETYSVPSTNGSTYTWTVPSGAAIVSGQGTNNIIVNFGNNNGNIEVVETTSGGCVNDIAKIYVNVGSSSLPSIEAEQANFFYDVYGNTIVALNTDISKFKSLMIFNSIGQKVDKEYFIQGNKIVLGSDLVPGLYIVTINTGKKQFTFKMVAGKKL